MYLLEFSPVIDRFPELLWGCLATIALAVAGMAIAYAPIALRSKAS